MSAPGKFDYSSNGQDRSLHRSSIAAQMERSSSFRETNEHNVSSSHLTMSRSTSPITQTDVTNFFQCLRFDPKAVAADHKSIRQADFRRNMSSALGTGGDDSPSMTLKRKLIPSPMPEEIKRLKTSLRENTVKARERVKIFREASSVFNKFFPSVPTKKRSRLEGFSSDRSGLCKPRIHGQNLAGDFEIEQQRSNEKPKYGVSNRRTRTSMMDARCNGIVRKSAALGKGKETARQTNHNTNQAEDRTLSSGIDCWEKSKMKKKRSVLKADGSGSMVPNNTGDGYRDLKLGILHKASIDSRSRSNGDLRQGATNGVSGCGRLDNLSHQTDFTRRSLSRPDSDHISSYNEKRERSIGPDKELVNLRAVNKSNTHEDFNSSSPISNVKANTLIRGPRSASGLPPKLSPSDWDMLNCTNKPNRRQTSSNMSLSPPVTQWASQRPQKISRTARRTNLVPIVSSNGEFASSDNISDLRYGQNGFGLHKPRGENSFSSTVVLESEESGPPEIRSRDKFKQSDDVPKASVPALQVRKNSKLVSREELGGNGIKRQGRIGRGSSSTRSPARARAGTAKQLHRQSLDKSGSKAGCPPSRKLSDRKAYKRQKYSAGNTTLDFLDDGHEELLAAANAAVNSVRSSPNPLWKQMDPYFCNISDEHINFLKEQREGSTMAPMAAGSTLGLDNHEVSPKEPATNEKDSKAAPLYQRLLSALIIEDFNDETGDPKLDAESELSSLKHVTDDNTDDSLNGTFSDDLAIDFADIPYTDLGIDQKVYLEIQSLGIPLDPLPMISNVEDGGIDDEIKKIEEALYKEGSKKKEIVDKLLSSAQEMKERQEKEFDQLGYEKLVEMAYEKHKASRPGSGKNSNNKVSKQASTAFVKRALERCRQFEETGKSCFSEPVFKEMFSAGLTPSGDAQGHKSPASTSMGLLQRSADTDRDNIKRDESSLTQKVEEEAKAEEKEEREGNEEEEEEEDEALDLSKLKIPGHEEDLSAWLSFNIDEDDDGLQDNDLVGLQIPMDDISQLKMVL